MTGKSSPISGRWRIFEMPDFDEKYVDAEDKAFLRFDENRLGEFHFGYVSGCIDHRASERGGKPAVEWSWEGSDENHPANGRIWAVLEDDGMLAKNIFFHEGDA